MAKPKQSDRRAHLLEVLDGLEARLQELMLATPRTRAELSPVPKIPAIYLLSESDQHLYVGRTQKLGHRLAQHMRQSSNYNSASFAFRIAKCEAQKGKVDVTLTGAKLERLPEFQAYFDAAKNQVANMGIRFIEIEDSIEQTLLEVYVAESLATRYNDFDTH